MTDYARAVELHAYGEDPKVAEIPIRAPRPGEVLVAMRQATVCGTDAHIAQGRFPGSSSIPLVMGHEGCGEIIAAGDERRFDALGQPVRPATWSCGTTLGAGDARRARSTASPRSVLLLPATAGAHPATAS